MIAELEAIVDKYQRQGYMLTVRQLYYQCVVANLVPNTERSYKMITGLVNDARLAGLIDWDAIEDRTRAFINRPSWRSPKEIVESCAYQFHMNMWENQPSKVFVIVEKEALVSVFNNVCRKLDVPLLAARGYPSVSVVRDFCAGALQNCDRAVILHFGDHDPSGIDMTRDLRDRIELLGQGADVEIERLALNMDQIEEKQPPPNPAKVTDSRFDDYARKYGGSSWELDALEPAYLEEIAEENIRRYIDEDAWEERVGEIETGKATIRKIAEKMK